MFGVACLFSIAYFLVFIRINGHPPIETFNGFHIAVMVVVHAFFYPLMFVIHNYSKKENNKGILIAARVLLFQMSLWIIMNIVEIITTT